MKEVKTYTINCEIIKPNFQTNLEKKIKATKAEDAIEKIFKILGSKHRIKRHQIIIKNIIES
jgi:ribosomal protein L20A (L18A)